MIKRQMAGVHRGSFRFCNEVQIFLLDDSKQTIKLIKKPNLVVNQGLNLVRNYLNQDLSDPMKYISIGDDGAVPAAHQTDLGNELMRDEIIKRTAEDRKVTFEFLLGTTLLNGETLREAGLHSTAGTMFARVTHEAINKHNIIQVLYVWTINIAEGE